MRTTIAQRVSYADYRRLEATGDAKHEWLDGVVYPMAGGTHEHSALSASVIALLTLGPGEVLRLTGMEAWIRVDEVYRDPMAG